MPVKLSALINILSLKHLPNPYTNDKFTFYHPPRA